MNECKRLSDCPADRLAQCRGEPVPPAGDVEVLEVYGYQCRQSAQEKFFLHEYPHYWQHIPLVRQAEAMERITRLAAERDLWIAQCIERTAERDGLLAELDQMTTFRDNAACHMKRIRGECTAVEKERDVLQSELTKARELLNEASGKLYVDTQLKLRIAAALVTPIAHNVDESCGQDAEAVKVNSVASKVDPYIAPAAKGGE